MAAEQLTGTLQRITFASENSPWTVARLVLDGSAETVTIVGDLCEVSPGERLKLEGRWVTDATYGRQFRFHGYSSLLPATTAGIRRYLSSGLVQGIGPTLARRLVDEFGAETLDVIERDPARLREVEGIGAKLSKRILTAYQKGRAVRDIMVFLHSHGVSPAFAAKIFKRYGDSAARVVKQEPYRLAMDIAGIGFLSADRIARQVGVGPDTLARAEAGLLHCLGEAVSDGHIFLPAPVLLDAAEGLLGVERGGVERALNSLQMRSAVVIEPLTEQAPPAGAMSFADQAVSLPRLHHAEQGIATRMARLCAAATDPMTEEEAAHEAIVAAGRHALGVPLSAGQQAAVKSALTSRVLVVTGGPGTGKTTIVRGILEAYRHLGLSVALTAPTGRAARRLQEATGREACTLHRLLEFNPGQGGYRRNAERPLNSEAVIVDEVSMLDVSLCNALLQALTTTARLLLVGDASQLPSVGPGAVLGDLIESGRVPVVRLTEIFRQSRESVIVRNAHRILAGGRLELPVAESDFFFIEKESPEEILDIIRRMMARRIPERFGLDPRADVQVLAPMYRGLLGTDNLNRELQALLNPHGEQVPLAGGRFKVGDKVMQVRNDYEKEVFNGDVGLVDRYDSETKLMYVALDERRVPYEAADLHQLVPAYAVTVHKSQGSEYPAIIIPLHTQHYVMLQRNLLYTAVTRGKRLVVLVGSRRALKRAIANDEMTRRYTRLAERLRSIIPE